MTPTKILDRKFFAAGALIIKQGTEGNRAFLIESGRVEVYAETPEGRRVTLAQLGPQSIIGEMAVLSHSPRTASVKAIEDTTVVTLSEHDILDSMHRTEGLFKRLTNIAMGRLRDTQERLLPKQEPEPAAAATPQPQAPAPAADLASILQQAMSVARRKVPAHTVFISEGARDTDAYLIESGRVEVFTTDAAGHEIRIKELGPKSVVGEMAALTKKPRSASVRTLEDTTLIVVAGPNLTAAAQKSAHLRDGLLGMVSRRLNETRLKMLGKPDSVDSD